MTHSPRIEERGVPHDAAEVRIQFDRELDPVTISSRTVGLGWIDRAGAFVPVPADLRLEGDRTRISLVPRTRLATGVYHHVRIRGGHRGVRSLDGRPLPDDYRWRFATGLVFAPPPDSRPQSFACPRPPSGGLPPVNPNYLFVHVYQAACNSPLLPGKPTLVRVYAPWYVDPQFPEEQQLAFFDAEVRFSEGGQDIGTVPHRFYRTDTSPYEALKKVGNNSANRFGWRPSGGTGTSDVEVSVVPTDGSNIRFSPGAVPFEWREWKTGRDELNFRIYTMEYLYGTGPSVSADFFAAVDMAEGLVAFAEENFPIRRARWSYEGAAWVGSSTTPNRGPVDDVPKTGPCKSGCPPTTRTHKYWDVEDSRGTTVDRRRIMLELADAVATAAGPALLTSPGDVAIGVIPDGLLGMGALAATIPTSSGQTVILTPPVGVQFVLHEVGHHFGLQHCPFTGCNCYCGGACRTPSCQVEGFRLDQSGHGGANKSQREGNGESPWLSALMEYNTVRRDEHTNAPDPSGGGSTVKEKFISQGSYRDLLLEFAQRPSPAPEPDGSPQLALAATGRTDDGGFLSDLLTPGSGCTSPEVDAGRWWTELGTGTRESSTASTAALGYQEGTRRSWSGAAVVVRGRVHPDGSDGWITSVTLEPEPPPASEASLEPVPGLSVVALGPPEPVREGVVVPVFDPLHPDFVATDPRAFEIALPAADGLTAIALEAEGGQVLDEYPVSANPPTVRLTEPQDGETLEDGDRVEWEGEDADGDLLSYRVAARYGEDDRWVVVGMTTESSLELEAIRLPTGVPVELRVLATDGVHTTASDTVAIEVRRAPVATAVLPEDPTPVDPQAALRIAFDTEMAPGTFDGAVRLEDDGGSEVPGTVSWSGDGREVVLTPESRLDAGAEYTLIVQSGVRDTFGNEIEDDLRWSFRTAEDTDAPWVRETLPAPGAFTVDPASTVRIQFSEALDPSSVTSGSVVVESEGSVVQGDVQWEAETRTVVFRPNAPLERNATMRVTVDGVRDVFGNALTEPYVFGFTTIGGVRPVDGAQGGGP